MHESRYGTALRVERCCQHRHKQAHLQTINRRFKRVKVLKSAHQRRMSLWHPASGQGWRRRWRRPRRQTRRCWMRRLTRRTCRPGPAAPGLHELKSSRCNKGKTNEKLTIGTATTTPRVATPRWRWRLCWSGPAAPVLHIGKPIFITTQSCSLFGEQQHRCWRPRWRRRKVLPSSRSTGPAGGQNLDGYDAILV